MQIQKRWPVLFALGSVFAYVGNNYTIGGIEHLRLQPRRSHYSPSQAGTPSGFGFDQAAPGQLPSTSPNWQRNELNGSDLTTSVLNAAVNSFQNGSADELAGKLGVGERLAVMQDQLSQKFSEIASRTDTGFPVPPPNNPPLSDLNRAAMGFGDLTTSRATDTKPVSTSASPLGLQPIMDKAPAIRLASFNLNSLGATQLAKPHVAEAIGSILRQFDLVALQGVQSERDDILPILVERLNQSGRRFDYLIGPRVGNGSQYQQFAFLFDTQRIETDRYQLYTIEDPENLMTFDPLVGWFRCKEGKAEESFTFSLVNIRVNRNNSQAEQEFVPNLFHAVANDGRKEDDLIIVGDFGGSPNRIAKLNSDSVRFAIKDIPTDVSGSAMNDSIVFPSKGTTEFTGRSGAYDFLRKHNLSLEQAMEISPNLPVWAEFYAVEGAYPGKVAPTNSKQPFQ
jgi:deoxyribonuclease-1-like protein